MITVLRIGHRIGRDKRITTHVALVARAFGADKIFIDTKDVNIEKNIKSVCKRFGGNFIIESGVDYKKIMKQWDGVVVHLTMYGQELDKSIKSIGENKNLLVVVGAEKVPAQVYELADFNVSVGNQPHSEVAALAVFLDHYNHGSWLKKKFNGKIEIIPSDRGKKVLSKNRS
ncbi:MAG: tRNA (cytidine(56)-2'-O)-methyltransferase [Candidatus Thermoplasmatota archaeon]|jgi:tRNA (cytidine56-2'-O)-methyltransferase|nr:tRNA (cytidine(56)-2'-O)-methyltransferase [Candidatus Thermoplasmatota archaeon]